MRARCAKILPGRNCFFGAAKRKKYDHAEVDRIWGIQGIDHGSLKDHITIYSRKAAGPMYVLEAPRQMYSSTPQLPFKILRYPVYQLIETIRPLMEVHWGV